MNRMIDNFNYSQRLGLLEELLDDLTPDEREMINTKFVADAVNTVETEREMARMIAEKRNNPSGGTSGVVGKKLI